MFYPHTIKGKVNLRLDLIGDIPTFSPNDITGLQGWIQGDAGLTTDLSDNSYTVTNTGVTIGTSLNGHDTFRYNGSSRQSFGTQLGKPASYTISAVVNVDAVTIRQAIFGSFNAAGEEFTSWGTVILSDTGETSKSLNSYFSNGATSTESASTTEPVINSTWHRLAIRYNSGDGFSEILVDGILLGTTDTTVATTNAGTAFEFAIGRPGAVASIELTGNIAELAVYNTYVTGTDFTNLDGYYTARYNL